MIMFTKKLLLVIAVLACTTLACGFTVNVPITTDIKTGPTVTEEILVTDPDPDADRMDVSIAFGAGELKIDSGAEALIEGTAVYNVEDLRPEVKTSDDRVEISTGNLEIEGIPRFDDRMENEWDLILSDRPMNLRIIAGAYQGDIELGGLSLTELHITDGAADVRVDFDEPNQEVLEDFNYETGASSVVLTNLGNANFKSMVFQGGAGNYELDFSGEMQADADVLVQTGLSNLLVTVPDDLNVQVRIEGGLTNIETRGSWGHSGGRYTHDGDGPALDITIKMGAGNLILEVE
jgi:hypothetical protein